MKLKRSRTKRKEKQDSEQKPKPMVLADADGNMTATYQGFEATIVPEDGGYRGTVTNLHRHAISFAEATLELCLAEFVVAIATYHEWCRHEQMPPEDPEWDRIVRAEGSQT